MNGGYYWTWEAAFDVANSSTKKVILNNAYTLPAAGDSDILSRNGLSGDGTYVDFTMDANNVVTSVTYKVPSGFTLLVPYNASHTGLQSDYKPQAVNGLINDKSYNLPDAVKAGLVPAAVPYSQGILAVGKGSTISSDGTLIVNGQQWATMLRDVGSACGPYGLIKLTDSTSSVHIQSGVLVCYGYIIGSGQVTVDSGAVLYELLQVADWRGFTFALSWLGVNLDTSNISLEMLGQIRDLAAMLGDNAKEKQKERRSFLFTQYYVQNIECALRMESGAIQNVVLTMNDSSSLPQYVIPFISSGKSFLKTSGSGHIIREYDKTNDRTIYRLNCDVDTGSIELSFGTTLLGIKLAANLDTANNAFSVCNNLTFIVGSGSTFTMATDMKLLPEATVVVEPGGNLVIAEGVEFFLYDKEDWLAGAYACQADLWQVNHVASNYDASSNGVPTKRVIDESSKLIISGILTISEGANIFTTAGYTRNGASTVADKGTVDKIVTGTGKIINYATISDSADFGKLDEFERGSGNFCVSHAIHTVSFVGKLAGVTDLQNSNYDSFGVGTYYGLGENFDNYWYQYRVNVNGGLVDVTSGTETGNASGVVAYVANSTTTNGSVIFVVTSPTNCSHLQVTASSTATLSGTYTLTGFTGDCTVTISHTIGENGLCTGCNVFPFYGSNVHLGNNLNMLFAFPKTGLDGVAADALKDCYVQIVRTYSMDKDGIIKAAETTNVPISEWYTYEGYYVVVYSGFAAKEMCDTITLTVYAGDKALSVSQTDSLLAYSLRMLGDNTTTATQKTVIVDMLSYGAACQTHFQYGTAHLATADLTAEQLALGTSDEEKKAVSDTYASEREAAKDYIYGANLVTSSNIELAIAFKGLTGDMYVQFIYTGHKGNNVVSGKLYPQKEANGYVMVPELVVADARCPITVNVCKADGTVVISWTESLESYVARNGATDSVFAAFMKFADSVYAYKHPQEATT